MRIIPDNIPTVTIDSGTIYGKQFEGKPMTFYEEALTIEVNLDDFREWYYQVWFRKEGGSIHYKDVAKLVQEWLDSAIFMSTDLETK